MFSTLDHARPAIAPLLGNDTPSLHHRLMMGVESCLVPDTGDEFGTCRLAGGVEGASCDALRFNAELDADEADGDIAGPRVADRLGANDFGSGELAGDAGFEDVGNLLAPVSK